MSGTSCLWPPVACSCLSAMAPCRPCPKNPYKGARAMPGEAEGLRKSLRTQKAKVEGSVKQSPGRPPRLHWQGASAVTAPGLEHDRTGQPCTGSRGRRQRSWPDPRGGQASVTPSRTRGAPVSAGCPGDNVIISWAPVISARALGCKLTCVRLPVPPPWFGHGRVWALGWPGAA